MRPKVQLQVGNTIVRKQPLDITFKRQGQFLTVKAFHYKKLLDLATESLVMKI
jgi:hypothetical protein